MLALGSSWPSSRVDDVDEIEPDLLLSRSTAGWLLIRDPDAGAGQLVAQWPTIYLVDYIGRNIQRWRRRRGLTQETLARRAGLHRVSLAQVERGASRPSLELVLRLARALRIRAGRLLDE